MKVKFPVLIRYPKQLHTLLKYLDSKGLHWYSGLSLIDSKFIRTPIWIFYSKEGISYWDINPANKNEFNLDYILQHTYYTPKEVEI